MSCRHPDFEKIHATFMAVDLSAFRTFGGTKIAYETNGNSLEVKRQLRHKHLSSTERYIGKIDFSKNDNFDTTSSTVVEEILRLGCSGWVEFSVVKINGVEHHCFKKPKAFRGENQMLMVNQKEHNNSNAFQANRLVTVQLS